MCFSEDLLHSIVVEFQIFRAGTTDLNIIVSGQWSDISTSLSGVSKPRKVNASRPGSKIVPLIYEIHRQLALFHEIWWLKNKKKRMCLLRAGFEPAT